LDATATPNVFVDTTVTLSARLANIFGDHSGEFGK
jgi:hypothetical protein